MPRRLPHKPIPSRQWMCGNLGGCPGTSPCPQRRVLLKFARDQRLWCAWLCEARRRFGLVVLDYTATSNHVHLNDLQRCHPVCRVRIVNQGSRERQLRSSSAHGPPDRKDPHFVCLGSIHVVDVVLGPTHEQPADIRDPWVGVRCSQLGRACQSADRVDELSDEEVWSGYSILPPPACSIEDAAVSAWGRSYNRHIERGARG